jgi:Ca2+-transporting ATPase
MWHSKTPSFIYEKLSCSKDGLKTAEANLRLAMYGKNALTQKKKKSVIARFFSAMGDKMTIILLIAAAISFIASKIGNESNADPIIILLIVVFNAIISVIQENKAEKALEALRSLTSSRIHRPSGRQAGQNQERGYCSRRYRTA